MTTKVESLEQVLNMLRKLTTNISNKTRRQNNKDALNYDSNLYIPTWCTCICNIK